MLIFNICRCYFCFLKMFSFVLNFFAQVLEVQRDIVITIKYFSNFKKLNNKKLVISLKLLVLIPRTNLLYKRNKDYIDIDAWYACFHIECFSSWGNYVIRRKYVCVPTRVCKYILLSLYFISELLLLYFTYFSVFYLLDEVS